MELCEPGQVLADMPTCKALTADRTGTALRKQPQRSGAYHVFTRKRAFLAKSPVKIWRRKGRFRPQLFVQRKNVMSGLSTLHHPKRQSPPSQQALKLANNSHTDGDTVDMD